MPDHIPAGHISLVEMFQQHFKRLIGRDPDISLGGWTCDHQEISQEIRSAFRDGKIEALYRVEGSEENKRVQSRKWLEDGFFPERLFLSEKVAHFSDPSPWSGLAGRTLFVNKEEFLSWSTKGQVIKNDRKKVQRGRKPKYDWEAFIEAAVTKLDYRGSFDKASEPEWNQAALEEEMRDWAEENWETLPAESTIRKYVTIAISTREGRLGR